MATIKSYTSVQQSRKLAEILPLESADMSWIIVNYGDEAGSRHEPSLTTYKTGSFFRDRIFPKDHTIPCWSLSALINIIPQELFDEEYIINITEGIDNKWIITYDNYENENPSYYGLSTGADNLIDACTDIIIKLKERNII